MLLNLVKTFDTPPGFDDFVGSQARVRKTGTQDPARLYTAEGALLSTNGQTALGNDGLLDVWVAPGYLYDLDLLNPIGNVVISVQGIDPAGGAGMSREQSTQLSQLFSASAEAGNVVYGAKSVSIAIDGLDVTLSDLVLTGSLTAAIETNVDWGDGNVVTDAGDLRTATAQHTYAAEGTYIVKVTPKATGTGVLGTPLIRQVPLAAVPGPLTLFVGRYTDSNIVEVGWNENISYLTTVIDWGDGTTTELDNSSALAHAYPDDGTYTITITERVSGVPTGTVGEITFEIATIDDYGPSPYVAQGVASAKNAIDDVTSIQFFDQSQLLDGAATSWLWDFGDAGTSTLQNPTHTYTAVGTYNPTLAVNGGTPVAVTPSIVVVAAPVAPAVTLRAADTFAVDGPVKDRALTTPLAGVFDDWDATGTDTPLTAGGKLTSAVPGSFAQFYTQQWQFGAPVTPPAALVKFVVEFDFTPGVTHTQEAPYSYSSQWDFTCTGTASSTNDGGLFKLAVQAGSNTDEWTFTGSVFGDLGTQNAVRKIITQGDSIHIKLVMTDTTAYILLGSTDIMVFSIAGRGVIGALNAVSMQLGPPVGGTPALDNFVISSVN